MTWSRLGATTREVEVLQEGVAWLSTRDYISLSSEMNGQEVVNLYSQYDTSKSIIASICQEIRELSSFFTSFELIYVNRAP
jgi:hypothetical protein